jgi:hypothetical protein
VCSWEKTGPCDDANTLAWTLGRHGGGHGAIVPMPNNGVEDPATNPAAVGAGASSVGKVALPPTASEGERVVSAPPHIPHDKHKAGERGLRESSASAPPHVWLQTHKTDRFAG